MCRAGFGVVINVVFAAMADQNGTRRFHPRNQIPPLHANFNSPTFLIPGITLDEKVS